MASGLEACRLRMAHLAKGVFALSPQRYAAVHFHPQSWAFCFFLMAAFSWPLLDVSLENRFVEPRRVFKKEFVCEHSWRCFSLQIEWFMMMVHYETYWSSPASVPTFLSCPGALLVTSVHLTKLLVCRPWDEGKQRGNLNSWSVTMVTKSAKLTSWLAGFLSKHGSFTVTH